MSLFNAFSARAVELSPQTQRLFTVVGRVLLVLWFICASAILLMRWLVTTEFERHTAEIEAFLSETTGIEIRAERMTAGFTAFRPLLKLQDVTLARPGGPVSLHLPEVHAEFSWSSLWHLEPRFHTLIVSAPSLAVRRLSSNELDIAGFVFDLSSSAETADAKEKEKDASAETTTATPLRLPFMAWVLNQGRVVVQNATLRYVDMTAPERPEVCVEHFTAAFEQRLIDWRASVTGTLQTTTEQDHPRPFDIRARLDRRFFMQLDEPLSWQGQLYADLPNTNVAALLQRLGFKDFVQRGTGAARLWASVDRGHVQNLTAELGITNVAAQLGPDLKPLKLDRLAGRFAFSESQSNLIASVERLSFEGPDKLRAEPASFSADCARDAKTGAFTGCTLRASEIVLGTLSRLGASLPLPKAAHEFLVKHPVTGSLRDLEASYSGDIDNPADWRVAAVFTGLSLPASDDGIPGFRNLSGVIRPNADGTHGVDVESHYASLYFPGIFREPRMDMRHFSGRVDIALEPRPKLTFSNMRVENADGAVTAHGTWEATGGAGTLDIAGDLERGRGEAVHKYLPNVVGDAALDYVASGVISGRATRGSFIVKGELAGFPWDPADPLTKKMPGQFLIEADVVDGVLDFFPSEKKSKSGRYERAANFPVMRGIDGHLEFAGNRMTITGRKGHSEGLVASNVVVEIPSFVADPPVLTVEGDIAGGLDQALGYLTHAKFLTGILGTPFSSSTASGPVTAHLSLYIPLSDAATKDTRYSVSAQAQNATFTYLPILPTVTNLSGALSVTNAGVTTPTTFKGVTEAGPVSVSASTQKNTVTLAIDAQANAEDVKRLADLPGLAPLLGKLSGSTPVTVSAQIPLSGEKPLHIEGDSRLTGLALALPSPLSKAATAELPARFTLDLQGDALALGIHALPLFNLQIALEKNELRSGYLGIGTSGQPRSPKSEGFTASVLTGTLDVDAWGAYLEPITQDLEKRSMPSTASPDTKTATGDSIPAVLKRVEVAAGMLSWQGQALGALNADWHHTSTRAWDLTLNGNLAKGTVRVAPKGGTGTLFTANLAHLHIPESATTQKSTAPKGTGVQPLGMESHAEENLWQRFRANEELPDFRITIEDLSWGKRRIGQLSANAENGVLTGGGKAWNLHDLKITSPVGTLTARGSWRANRAGDAGETALHANMQVSNTGNLLTRLDIRDVVHDAPGSVTADLAWKGAPLDFNTATLSGAIQGQAGAGRLLQIEPGAGRLLSLLSMQHLLRRLALDFNDVLARGFSFDAITTDATLRQGVMTLKKAAITGSAANVVTSGDIDLVNELMDLRAVVLPSLHAEGPALALAVVNPAVSVGTLLAQWLFKDQISGALSTEYAIQGSFDDPVISKVSGLLPAPTSTHSGAHTP